MELSFIASALRRYWWVVVLFAALGAVPGLLRPPESGGDYDSEAVLLIAPSTESRVQSTAGDPDRYIFGQLRVLRGDALAEQVATNVSATLGDDYTGDAVQRAATFTNQPGTDIVEMTVSAGAPEVAQAIGDEYVDQYFTGLRTRVDEAQEPEIANLQARLDQITSRLTAINTSLRDQLAPFLPTGPVPEGESPPPIPSADQVAPELVTERDLLLNEFENVSATLSELDINARLRVASEVIQRPTLPTEPESTPPNRLLVAGILAGTFVGLLAAVVLARLSRRVLDDAQAADVLGEPMVGVFPVARAFNGGTKVAVEQPPAAVVPFVNALCVRAQLEHTGDTFVVVVVGTRSGAGCTTLAGSVANRFAQSGSSVLLIDANVRHPDLTNTFDVPRALSNPPGGDGATVPFPRDQLDRSVVPTAVERLGVAGLDEEVLRRPQQVVDFTDAVRSAADVVVIDGGTLLSSAATVQLTRLGDAVMLAVPRRPTVRNLSSVARALRGRHFLPVLSPGGRRRKRAERAAAPVEVVVTDDDVPTGTSVS